MKDISLEKAYVVALWMEALLYGVYSVLFAICFHVLVYQTRKGRSKGLINKPMLGTAIIMFVLCSVRVCLDLGRAISAFVSSDDIGGAGTYFNQLWIWSDVFKQALYVTNNVVADSLVVYRCYVVWGYSWKIITGPILMLLGTTVCGYVVVVNFSLVKPGEDVFSSDIMKWATGLFSMSLATNVIVTSLIAVRIWWISRRTVNLLGKKHGRKYAGALAIILESGAIYSVSLLTLLILYLLKTNAQFIVYDALAQIMGIVPTLIIVRVGLGLSTQETHETTLSGITTTIDSRTGGTTVRGTFHNTAASNIPMQIRKIIEVEDHSDADDLERSIGDVQKQASLHSHERAGDESNTN